MLMSGARLAGTVNCEIGIAAFERLNARYAVRAYLNFTKHMYSPGPSPDSCKLQMKANELPALQAFSLPRIILGAQSRGRRRSAVSKTLCPNILA